MKNLQKSKLFLDVAMAAVFLLLLNLDITDVLVYEILGILVFVMFIAHVILNRKWIVGIYKNFSSGAKTKAKVSWILDMLIAIFSLLAIVSGVLISIELFPFLALADPSFMISAHIVVSYVAFALLVIHTLMHFSWIRNTIKRLRPRLVVAKRVVVSAVTFLIIGATLYSMTTTDRLIEAALPAKNETELLTTSDTERINRETILPTKTVNSATEDQTVAPTATAQVDGDIPTLEEYLSKLHCNGCSRHCPLTMLQCSKGDRYLQQETSIYYEIYGS